MSSPASNNPLQPPATQLPTGITPGAGTPPTEPLSQSPFAKMFPGGLTKKELQQFISNFVKMMIFECKQSDQAWKKAQEHLKRVEEGKE